MSGGEREGAGRPAGSRMTRQENMRAIGQRSGKYNLPSREGQTARTTHLTNNTEVPYAELRLLELKPHVQTALRLLVRGRPITYICDELNLSNVTITKYRDMFPQALVDASYEIVEPGEVLRPLLPKVVQVYDKLLDRDDEPAVQSTVARDVMDRLFGKSTQRHEIAGVPPVNVEFIDLPATVLAEE